MAAYIDQNIVIVESEGYDVTALYRLIPRIMSVFPREYLWRHKQKQYLAKH
jgi:hypothetical protein